MTVLIRLGMSNLYDHCRCSSKNIPGPGQYEVRRQFDKQTPKTNLDGVDVEHPPFLSQTKVQSCDY